MLALIPNFTPVGSCRAPGLFQSLYGPSNNAGPLGSNYCDKWGQIGLLCLSLEFKSVSVFVCGSATDSKPLKWNLDLQWKFKLQIKVNVVGALARGNTEEAITEATEVHRSDLSCRKLPHAWHMDHSKRNDSCCRGFACSRQQRHAHVPLESSGSVQFSQLYSQHPLSLIPARHPQRKT